MPVPAFPDLLAYSMRTPIFCLQSAEFMIPYRMDSKGVRQYAVYHSGYGVEPAVARDLRLVNHLSET